ncbi:MAG: hypothetical protein JF615_03635 [Asticcacaulis sp.]|nr:hypothetical protein [Asticcacaulis sp.]
MNAPVVIAIAQPSPGTVVVTGQALPDGRVRFLYGQARAVGVTADSQGRFTAELPISGAGGIYDLSMEDAGALQHAEGRLFVPAGQPAKAVLLRPGSPAVSIIPAAMGVTTVDYDAAGALGIAGRVAPHSAVNVVVNGEVRWQPMSDAAGNYSAVTQIPPPSDKPATIALAAEAAGAEWKRTISVSAPAGDQDAVTAVDGGWRVDWHMPAGGVQTTLVF